MSCNWQDQKLIDVIANYNDLVNILSDTFYEQTKNRWLVIFLTVHYKNFSKFSAFFSFFIFMRALEIKKKKGIFENLTFLVTSLPIVNPSKVVLKMGIF